MVTPRRVQFVGATVAWMTAALVGLTALEAYSLELFFVVSLVGFLVVTELTAPTIATPPWRKRLRWFIALGLLGFGAVVIRRILRILPEGVV